MSSKAIAATPIKRHKGRAAFLRNLSGWLIMLPSVLLFSFYVWVPLLESVVFSFSETKGFKIIGFAGFDNYISVVTDSVFSIAFLNTVKYVVCSLIIGFVVPIILALLISEIVHLKGLFRVGIYFPNVVPGMASILMWQFLMTSNPNGAANVVLSMFGLPAFQWFAHPVWGIPIIVVILTWKSCGSTALIYLAALQGINQELYEAAAMDGAGIFGRMRYITIPCIYNNARSLLILQVLSVFQILYEPMVLTDGGPNNATTTLMLVLYKHMFSGIPQAGKAAAVGVIVSIILLVLTLVYNKIVKEQDA